MQKYFIQYKTRNNIAEIPSIWILNGPVANRAHYLALDVVRLLVQNFYVTPHVYHGQTAAVQRGHRSREHDNKALLYARHVARDSDVCRTPHSADTPDANRNQVIACVQLNFVGTIKFAVKFSIKFLLPK